MRRARRSGLRLLVAAVAGAGCGLSDSERAAIDAWMLCDECDAGQQPAVRALGDRAVNALAIRLREPPMPRYEVMRRKFAESFQPGFGMTEEAYVALMLEGYVALYQTRAALSLGDIGTPPALRELRLAMDEASVRGYRPDVLRAIERSLVGAALPAFEGAIGDSVVGFGDTIVVHADPGPSWDGNEAVVLHGSPFARQLLAARWEAPQFDDSLAFVAVGDVGEYMLSVWELGPSQIKQSGRTIRIASLSYETHTAMAALPLMGSPFPQTRYVALQPVNGTADYFRFEPATDTTVTIVARWPGLDAVTLDWRTCAPSPAPVGAVLSGVVVDEQELPLPGTLVSVTLGVPIVSVATDSSGSFSMTIPPPPGGVATLRLARIGYRMQEHRVPVSLDGLRIGMVPAAATRATARNLSGFTVTIPGGSCRQLGVVAQGGGKPRIIQLRFY